MSSTPSGATACELLVASEIGASLIRRGGSAADAMVAMVLVVGVMSNYHTGIGGGGFALIRESDGKYKGMDFRVAAPAAAHPKMYNGVEHPSIGPLSIAVPGELAGLEHLHKTYGKLAWEECLRPAIDLCENGWVVSEDLYEAMILTLPSSNHASRLPTHEPPLSWINTYNPTLASLLVSPSTKAFYRPGDKLYNRALGSTLREVAEKGVRDAFYEGRVGRDMVETIREHGGIMTEQDLEDYHIRHTSPLSINYRSSTTTIHSTGAPSSGSVLLSALNTLGRYPSDKIPPPGSVEMLHRTVEAMKFAYAQRSVLGDPEFLDQVETNQNEFLTEESANRIKSKIEGAGGRVLADREYAKGVPKVILKNDHGTSHFLSSDSSGLVISLTSTIMRPWGSRIMCPRTGIILNDGMEDFSVEERSNEWGYEPTRANYIAGGKRPLSSQSPYIIEDSQTGMIFAGGCAGGSRIISANTQIARNCLDYDMSPFEALSAPRVHNQLAPNVTLLEMDDEAHEFKGFSVNQEKDFIERGHVVERVEIGLSTSCAIKWTREKGWEASGEPRKFDAGGVVIGKEERQ